MDFVRRLLHPATWILAGIVALGYTYMVLRLGPAPWFISVFLAVLCILVWAVPVIYWLGRREKQAAFDAVLPFAGFVSMGWLSFLLVLSLARDFLLVVCLWLHYDSIAHALETQGPIYILGLSTLAVVAGALSAWLGPAVRQITVAFPNLPPGLDGFRIVQISDLHVGPTIGQGYVERVVRKANELKADLVALTGDLVDGKVAELRDAVAPLANLQPSDCRFFITGNHEYYSGAAAWLEHFRGLGFQLLLNTHAVVPHNGARLMVAGVLDAAVRMMEPESGPDPVAAAERPAVGNEPPAADFRLLLAHNPKVAAAAERAGFDLQLSGHTHGGQFFPWTLVARLVHAPHYVGLSRRGAMQVYVSAGTGTWGPPLRLGTSPEVTLIRLVRATA